jgi:hypothetical protein
LREKAAKALLPESVEKVTVKEFDRLDQTDPSVAEYSIGLNYVKLILSLPWSISTEDNLDLDRAEIPRLLFGKVLFHNILLWDAQKKARPTAGPLCNAWRADRDQEAKRG